MSRLKKVLSVDEFANRDSVSESFLDDLMKRTGGQEVTEPEWTEGKEKEYLSDKERTLSGLCKKILQKIALPVPQQEELFASILGDFTFAVMKNKSAGPQFQSMLAAMKKYGVLPGDYVFVDTEEERARLVPLVEEMLTKMLSSTSGEHTISMADRKFLGENLRPKDPEYVTSKAFMLYTDMIKDMGELAFSGVMLKTGPALMSLSDKRRKQMSMDLERFMDMYKRANDSKASVKKAWDVFVSWLSNTMMAGDDMSLVSKYQRDKYK